MPRENVPAELQELFAKYSADMRAMERDATNVVLNLSPAAAANLLHQLQRTLAFRTDTDECTATLRVVAMLIEQQLSQTPAIKRVCEMGWNVRTFRQGGARA